MKRKVNTNPSYKGGKRIVLTAAIYLAVLMVASNLFITPAKAQILGGTVSAISAGGWHSLALESDGTVWAWGYNGWGQLGDGTDIDSSIAVQVSGLTGITAVSAGEGYSMALKNDGTVWAWGSGGDWVTGDPSGVDQYTPFQVLGISDVIAISAKRSFTLALKSDGTVWGWGNNQMMQLGEVEIPYTSTPVQIPDLSDIVAISAGNYFSLALKSDGTVWAWGQNDCGQLGYGEWASSRTPVQFSGLSDVIAISAGGWHSLALKSDGTVWACGQDIWGELGDGSYTDKATPGQVLGLSGIVAISANFGHSLALKSDGTVWAWGLNDCGQLGDGTTTDSSIALQVPGLTGITAISAGGSHSLALGSIWAWGANSAGQLGDGTTSESPVTTPVPVYTFDLAVESGFKSGDSPSFALNPYLSDVMCVLAKANDVYKLAGTSPGTLDYAISIENTGTGTYSSIAIDVVQGNNDFNLHSSNPIRVLDAIGASITSQFTISGNWPTITISSNELFQGLLGSSSLYITIHLDYALKGTPVQQPYSKAYTFQTTVSVTSGSNSMSMDTYGSVAFLSRKATIVYGFVKTSSGTPVQGAIIDLIGSTLTCSDTTDADGFYCFIDGVDQVALSGGTTYTVECTGITKQVTAQANEAMLVNFQV